MGRNWHFLKPGDIVDVVAPASSSPDSSIRRIPGFLRSLGLIPRLPEDIFDRDFWFSNSLEYRLRHLYLSLNAQDSKAVWSVRGGYGSLNLIPKLIRKKRPKYSKLFIGLSDNTSIHSFLNYHWNWPTLYGPNLDRLSSMKVPVREIKEVKSLLFGDIKKQKFSNIRWINPKNLQRKIIEGVTVGGNLKTFVSSIGTDLKMRSKGKIYFFEDIDERGYALHRMFEQLKQSKLTQGIQAIILGDFVGGLEKDGKSLSAESFKMLAKDINVPIIKGLRVGHGELQRCFPLGAPARIRLGTSPTIEIDSGGIK